MKGIVVAGTASSTGKTTVTLGLMAALQARGFHIQPFKVGPDYIDPGHHSALLGRPSYNLDTWMCGTEAVKSTYRRVSAGAELSVIEGVMGLFDGKFAGSKNAGKVSAGGLAGVSCEGSTAHLAKVLKKPVLLVIDAQRAATSAGAVVKGFCDFDPDPDLRIKYIIFNRVGSDRHAEILESSIKGIKGITLLGCIRRDEKLKMPGRHLGLVTNADLERRRWKVFLETARKAVEGGIDIERLLRLLRVKSAKPKSLGFVSAKSKSVKQAVTLKKATLKGIRIAVASDSAFCFYYQENLDNLVKAGARLVYFSPIKSKTLPSGVSGIYLGGGYPELHTKELEANVLLKEQIKTAAESGMPILAECGGLIYLCDSLKMADSSSTMVGLFSFKVEMTLRRTALGYRELTTAEGFPFLPPGESIRGHEYHYSRIIGSQKKTKAAFTVEGRNRDGEKGCEHSSEGFIYKQVVASYTHLHFASNKAFAPGFISACESFKTHRL